MGAILGIIADPKSRDSGRLLALKKHPVRVSWSNLHPHAAGKHPGCSYPGEMKRIFPGVAVVDGPHLSTLEVALMIGRHQSTAVDYLHRGMFPNAYLQAGTGAKGVFRVPRADVLKYLDGSFLSVDARARQEAQAWLAVRTNDGKDAISYLDLEDFEFDGSRLPLKSRQRGIWKPRILDAALSITTTFRRPGQERPYEDQVGTDGMLRYKWQGDEIDAADNRALRRAMDDGLPLIWFFGVAQGLYQPVFPVFLIAEEIDKQQFVVDIDPHGGLLGVDVDLESPIEVEAVKRYGTRIARTRLHQRLFRSTVLNAYGTRCAICNLKHKVLLDAAHIIPDAHDDGAPTVVNGMAMCKIHHAAFDAHILGVRPDLVVEIRGDILAEIDGPMLKYGLQERHGQELMSVPHAAFSRDQAGRPSACSQSSLSRTTAANSPPRSGAPGRGCSKEWAG